MSAQGVRGKHAAQPRPPAAGRLTGPRMLSRRALAIATAVVVLAVIAAATAYAALDKTVTVSVDGRTTRVHTFARSVSAVLAARGITVDLAHDQVSPAPSSGLRDGETVVVRFGRPVVLTVDGSTRTVWTTGRTVAQALTLLGVRTTGAYLSASRSRPIGRGGVMLDVRMPHHLTFLADGKRHEITTTAPTVRSAMAQAGVAMRTEDRVSVNLAQSPFAEQVVSVTRVDGRTVREQRPIRYTTVKRRSATMFRGETKVVTAGKVGVQARTFATVYLDGRLDSRRLLRTTISQAPVTQVVMVGTKNRPDHAPAADGLNWAALAQCESGGNPAAYSPAGPFYGLYQFMEGTWLAVGGVGLPSQATPAEQTYRAQILYNRSGAGQWPVCGYNLFR